MTFGYAFLGISPRVDDEAVARRTSEEEKESEQDSILSIELRLESQAFVRLWLKRNQVAGQKGISIQNAVDW